MIIKRNIQRLSNLNCTVAINAKNTSGQSPSFRSRDSIVISASLENAEMRISKHLRKRMEIGRESRKLQKHLRTISRLKNVLETQRYEMLNAMCELVVFLNVREQRILSKLQYWKTIRVHLRGRLEATNEALTLSDSKIGFDDCIGFAVYDDADNGSVTSTGSERVGRMIDRKCEWICNMKKCVCGASNEDDRALFGRAGEIRMEMDVLGLMLHAIMRYENVPTLHWMKIQNSIVETHDLLSRKLDRRGRGLITLLKRAL